MREEELTVAFRAYVKRINQTRTGIGSTFQLPTPDDLLVFDTETTTDEAQQLNFGFFRWLKRESPKVWAVKMEGLLYADNLPNRMPDGFRRLKGYADRSPADCAVNRQLVFLSQTGFLKEVFWPVATGLRGMIVGFNLPFDLTRIALDAGLGRDENRGAFSLLLSSYTDKESGLAMEHPYTPRVIVRPLDSSKAFINLATPKGGRAEERYRGRFLDLKTLVHTLTGKKVTLKKACELFGTKYRKRETEEHGIITRDYIEYARDDVRATQDLFEAAINLFDTHPVSLDPCKAYSPATLAKAYLRAAGVTPLKERFPNLPDWLYGASMAAFYGGRAEVRVRRTAIPVVHTDFKSMYPTVNTLMKHSDILTAETLTYVDATEDVRMLAGRITLDQCFDPAAWPELRFFAEIIPQAHVLPVRARYDSTPGLSIGVNPLTTDAPIWIAGPDLVASVLQTGRVPQIIRAFRLIPSGKSASLRCVRVGGKVTYDPRENDLFKLLIELRIAVQADSEIAPEERERIDTALKLLANGGSFGVFAELNPDTPALEEAESVLIFGNGDVYEGSTRAVENPGQYFFPPLASLITAGARLMLTLLERLVTERGSELVFCDTDSGAIAATKRGGLIPCEGGPLRTKDGRDAVRALSWKQVREEIVARFDSLNPYDRNVLPGSVLEVKGVNFDGKNRQREIFAYAISAKRYAFFLKRRNGEIEIVEGSEHGLGHLLDPNSDKETETARDADTTRPWIRQVWKYLIELALGVSSRKPWFWDAPAVTRLTVTSPALLKPFATSNSDATYAELVKPCGFLIAGHAKEFGNPAGVDKSRFHLVQPYSRDVESWRNADWVDIHSCTKFRATNRIAGDPNAAVFQTFGDVIERYAVHLESKSCESAGNPCKPLTRGLLNRRAVVARSTGVHVGKEANKVEEVEWGIIHDFRDIRSVFIDPARDPITTLLLPALKRIPLKVIARKIRRSERQARSYRNGHVRPPTELIPDLWDLVREGSG